MRVEIQKNEGLYPDGTRGDCYRGHIDLPAREVTRDEVAMGALFALIGNPSRAHMTYEEDSEAAWQVADIFMAELKKRGGK